MTRRKQQKLDTFHLFKNVILSKNGNVEREVLNYLQPNKDFVLEIGCGRGDYSISLAQKFPDKNFVALDIKPARLWNGADNSLKMELKNIVFLQGDAIFLDEWFTSLKFAEIWITFPDPHFKKRLEKSRLTNHFFLKKYRNILLQNGFVHLKTDDEMTYNYALEQIEILNAKIDFLSEDIYSSSELNEILSIKTKYEEKHLLDGKSIKIIKFNFLPELE